MAAKRRRTAPKRRKTQPRRRRPRWVLRVVLMGGLLVAVFGAAAAATLWLTQSRPPVQPSAVAEPAPSFTAAPEGFTQEERDALEGLLQKQGAANKP